MGDEAKMNSWVNGFKELMEDYGNVFNGSIFKDENGRICLTWRNTDTMTRLMFVVKDASVADVYITDLTRLSGTVTEDVSIAMSYDLYKIWERDSVLVENDTQRFMKLFKDVFNISFKQAAVVQYRKNLQEKKNLTAFDEMIIDSCSMQIREANEEIYKKIDEAKKFYSPEAKVEFLDKLLAAEKNDPDFMLVVNRFLDSVER